MTNRLWILMLVATPIYTIGITFILIVGRVYTGPEVLANVAMGVAFGVLATFLADSAANRPYLRDGALNIAFFTALAVMFGAFNLRGNFIYGYVDFFGETVVEWGNIAAYIGRFAWRGAALGVVLWLLVMSVVGFNIGSVTGAVIAVAVTVGGLVSAPYLANALFNGAPFVVVTLGTRLTLGLLVGQMSSWWHGFLFGAAAGFIMIILPLLGFYGYGVL